MKLGFPAKDEQREKSEKVHKQTIRFCRVSIWRNVKEMQIANIISPVGPKKALMFVCTQKCVVCGNPKRNRTQNRLHDVNY